MSKRPPLTRRRALRLGVLVGTASIAGCTGSNDGGGSGGGGNGGGGSDSDGDDADATDTPSEISYDGWLSDVSNYDGRPADRTGQSTVEIAVGAGNGLLFDPPAVRVSPGTTVVWEWTGQGGQHNVQAESGAFESELFSEEGSTFEYTFDESGAVPYLCLPHEAVGMKGVVDVVDG